MESILWFLIAGGLFYFMMKHGCGAHMGGHGRHRKHEGHEGGHSDHGEYNPLAISQKVNDPACGMDIDRDQAYAMIRKHGKEIFFCSETCHEKFRMEPERYLSS